MVIQRDLQIPTVKKKSATTAQYSARLGAHPNDLIVNLIGLTGDCEDTRQMICLPDS
jgi:hypothetical protein